MDAHVVRRVCAALAPVLTGARLEKIHRPAPDIYSITFYAAGHKQHLVLRTGRRSPVLYLSPHRPPAPSTPDAVTMRLRKYLCGRRVTDVLCDWSERRLALRVSSPDETWLVLDMREGPSLASAFVATPDVALVWPSFPALFHAAGVKGATPLPGDEMPGDEMPGGMPGGMSGLPSAPDAPVGETSSLQSDAALGQPAATRHGEAIHAEMPETATSPVAVPVPVPASGEVWRAYPVLTPLLRKTLPLLDPAEAAALLVDLEGGEGDLFLYEGAGGPVMLSAWPLPVALAASAQAEGGVPLRERVLEDPLEAARIFGEANALGGLTAARHDAAARPFKAESVRLGRLLSKLDDEERRLRGLLAEREAAVALQGVLYLYPPDAKLDHVDVPGEHAPVRLELDPRKTVRENMAAMFHRSERGARGLAMLEERRASVRCERATAEGLRLAPDRQVKTETGRRGSQVRARAGSLPKTVQAFRSDDGFRLLRGRSAEGNAALLRLASPHDIWMHAEDGPSAHLVIRRDHAAQEVPESTLMQAAVLVGLRSWQRDDAQARIMCAYVKDVRPVRGAPAGKVRVERSFTTLVARLDAGLESRLAEDSTVTGDIAPTAPR